MRHLLLGLAALVGFASPLLVGPAYPFGTVRLFGQGAEHEKITRLALGCDAAGAVKDCFEPASLDDLAGRDFTFGAVGAPDDPLRGLIFEPEAHCDNGDWLEIADYPQTREAARAALEACRGFMRAHLGAAVDAADALARGDKGEGAVANAGCGFRGRTGQAKCDVLEQFGLALHASQDFYAHSNWTDMADPERPISPTNPPGLGNTGPAPWLDLREGAPSFPEGLITGCFGGVPEAAFCNGGPGRVKHETLDKDTGQIAPAIGAGTTARGRIEGNFARAVEAAVADTRDKWATLEERLVAHYGAPRGRLMICILTRDDLEACRPEL
jgi:hypothetical protein